VLACSALALAHAGPREIRVARSSENPAHSVPGDRQRFTVVHELGHLSLHHDCPPPNTPSEASRYAKHAHRFAAAFLVPAEPLLADLSEWGGSVTLNTLAHLKQRWGLAIKALIVRFRHLGLIDEAHARSLYKQISARKWNTDEPVNVPNERAQWLPKSMCSRLGPQPSVEAARRTGLGGVYFDTDRLGTDAIRRCHGEDPSDTRPRSQPDPDRRGVRHSARH
jgi:Zn-dependent peptidase ImmA (M78 family)